MLSVTDSKILNDFFSKRPNDPKSDEDYKKFSEWNDFRKFIKETTDLKITNSKSLNPEIKKLMTDGLGETKKEFLDDVINLSDGKIPGKYRSVPATFFCLVEKDFEKRKRIRSKNGFLFGFEDDYFQKWSALSLKKINTPIIIGSEDNSFKSWHQLKNFVLPFTDLIISDSYILSDNSLIDSNLFSLWEILDSLNPVKYNMLIITYEGYHQDKKLNIKNEFSKIIKFKNEMNLKCDVGLVFTSRVDKVHDRNIIMNYLRIKSGDTFNFFLSSGDKCTSTEIDLYSTTSLDGEKATMNILKKLSEIVSKAGKKNGVKYEGNIKNRLLINNL